MLQTLSFHLDDLTPTGNRTQACQHPRVRNPAGIQAHPQVRALHFQYRRIDQPCPVQVTLKNHEADCPFP